jgi:hypothetical protein
MALLQKAYLGATPLFRNEAWFEESYDLINNSGLVTVTADPSAHTKGAWSEANSEGISFSGASGTWVEATASTSQAYRAVAIIPSAHSATVTTIGPTA